MYAYSEEERMADFNYFLEHYNEIYRTYGHKFIAIRKCEILGVYDDAVSAINATSKTYPLGTFIVQECNGEESGYTNYISSWQIVGF